MAGRHSKKKPRKSPVRTESSGNDKPVSPQHLDAKTNNRWCQSASEHMYGHSEYAGSSAEPGEPECANLDQGFSEESIRRQLGFAGGSPARTDPSMHRTWDESGVGSWWYACGSNTSPGGITPPSTSIARETWQNCAYQGLFLHGDAAAAAAQRDAEGMVFGTSPCGSEAKRGEAEPQWDVNAYFAYFAPLDTRHMQMVRRGKGSAKDEWECDFCGFECFCWGLTDEVAEPRCGVIVDGLIGRMEFGWHIGGRC
ncbi:hypothetical protein COCC4DRAFT_66124 [Bipolaris maydis ATCC 48331]|uniref:Uncharacterized protein n=2 Tax=Cochliobolus heterostrophus TaxID=5016 RepID=M2UND0_COCH5|nr:uncharacterized protein COCC4DRAFT_66124 [Bipolaris maydis ATCC 48331]EMD89443.1 hypothetical protein COCHEDRAFT_1032472 [Bipolaris maydis C5]KAH7552761.1 hypothetical protein BM1_08712 [Bipolaris maydis]ENH99698.1 hypothetical protein COCC4DRAFT_66124 [Bipolaris maydis ATCC 48331]KAJ5025067.1 hypothetical protein J3E73DRAFT_258937 [Bipolaris maydis]KAJ5057292.1 hypothetical protein J3E74DRAFT_293703 [Bipolaris maydis]